ncbi:hypothetical protein Tco_1291017 [Tanacetum coccineum]
MRPVQLVVLPYRKQICQLIMITMEVAVMDITVDEDVDEFKNTSSHKKWQDKEKNENDRDEKEKGITANSCYCCGSFDHWAKHYDILDDHKDQTDATHLDDDEFLTNE